MSILSESANKNQLIDILNSMKFPIMGAGGGFAPIGTRAYFDGTLAPEGWLLCDGSTYNIADYPELAAYFASHHGSANYYGGNGTTTFATPVMNGMPNGGVETPDEHIVGEWRETIDGVLKQKPVYKKGKEYQSTISISNSSWTGTGISNADIEKIINAFGTSDTGTFWSLLANRDSGSEVKVIACRDGQSAECNNINIRYTKTTDSWSTIQEGHSSDGNGVFCVKATVSGDPNAHQYSTEEQVIGMTEDGKEIYEKTYENVSISNGADNIVDSRFSHNLYDYNIIPRGLVNQLCKYSAYVTENLMVRNGQLIEYFNYSGTWWHGWDKADIIVQYTKTS